MPNEITDMSGLLNHLHDEESRMTIDYQRYKDDVVDAINAITQEKIIDKQPDQSRLVSVSVREVSEYLEIAPNTTNAHLHIIHVFAHESFADDLEQYFNGCHVERSSTNDIGQFMRYDIDYSPQASDPSLS